MKKLYRLGFLAVGIALALTMTLKSVRADQVLRGASEQIGQGTASSYVRLDDRGSVSEIGVILSESALAGLPPAKTEVNLPLPAPALTKTPFTHIGLDWNPQGHLPPPIYGTPHFDLHFYTISQTERQRITAIGDDAAIAYKTPDASLVPTGYVMAPESAEPGQGSHWINSQAPEFQGAPHGFDYTLIYGFYNGRMTFLEPMISKAAMEQHQTFDEPIARASRYVPAGAYPGRYSMSYDPNAREFRIALSDVIR